ncbi:MAG: tilS, partial [Frankiales bacterium]|nr:tilS [Frankiales bacterium]
MGPHPAVAATRLAVRRSLREHAPAGALLLVACSGGADSMALAAATLFEARRADRAAGLVTVDHGLQAGSDRQAERVATLGYELGFDPVHLIAVTVPAPAAAGGPEAAARAARYSALEAVRGSACILLGHTADDQAETVLLGLGRGSGPGSIQGMAPARAGYLRPLLGLRRSDTVACCAALGLPVWDDPHNSDPQYRRVRLRAEALPLLDDVLGGGVAGALARTAALLHEDLEA